MISNKYDDLTRFCRESAMCSIDDESEQIITLAEHILSPRQMEVFKRLYLGGEKLSDISAELGVDISTVSVTAKRARKRIIALYIPTKGARLTRKRIKS